MTRRPWASRGLSSLLVTACALLVCSVATGTPRRLASSQRPRAAGPLLTASWMGERSTRSSWPALVRRGGRIEAVEAPLGTLMGLAERSEVERIEVAWPLSLHLVEGTQAVGLAPARKDRGSRAATGRGVIVGIVDTGIDWSHPDFLDDEGRPRIAWLLDLSLSPREGAHAGVDAHGGALWSQEELTEAVRGERFVFSADTLGHGTHVAGVVGGRGSNTGLGADGLAPDVEFIVVKATRTSSYTLNEVDVLEGLRFILERADALQRPVVINLSLGGHVGPHDGSSLFEQALLETVSDRPGRVLVVSAGNSGDDDIHASGRLATDGVVELPIVIPSYERRWSESQVAVVDLWYEADGGAPLTVALAAPDGRVVAEVPEGDSSSDLDPVLGSLSLTHEMPQQDSPGLQQIVVTIQEPESRSIASGAYVVRLTGGEGRFDAWIAFEGAFNARFGALNDATTRLTVPGTLEAAITVGAFVSSDRWTDRSGEEHLAGLPIGSIAPFSGTGPTRDGRPKPDLVAPGFLVASALSADADPRSNPDSVFGGSLRAGNDPVLRTQRHAVARGTSAATPFVTGAAALLLEQDPSLTANDVRSILRATTSRPTSGAPFLWDSAAGFGLLNVPRALDIHAAPGRLDPGRSDVGLTRGHLPDDPLACTRALILPRDSDGRPLSRTRVPEIKVDLDGVIGHPEIRRGRWLDDYVHVVEICAADARGVGAVVVTVGGQRLEASPMLRFATPDLAHVRGGGGCQAASSSRPSPQSAWWAVLGLVVGAGITGRRRRSSVRSRADGTAPRTPVGRGPTSCG